MPELTKERERRAHCAHTHTHLLHSCAHIPYTIGYCLLFYKCFFSLLSFDIHFCVVVDMWLCVALMLFLYIFPSFVWLFIFLFFMLSLVSCVAFIKIFFFDSRFFSLFLRCTAILCSAEWRFWRAHIFTQEKRARTYSHRTPASKQSFMFMYYFDPHSIFMIDCSMAILFDFESLLLKPLPLPPSQLLC